MQYCQTFKAVGIHANDKIDMIINDLIKQGFKVTSIARSSTYANRFDESTSVTVIYESTPLTVNSILAKTEAMVRKCEFESVAA